MTFFKQLIIDQLESILSVYNSFPDKCNEDERKDLEEITQCLEILKKDNGE